jgi:hypothetical protein
MHGLIGSLNGNGLMRVGVVPACDGFHRDVLCSCALCVFAIITGVSDVRDDFPPYQDKTILIVSGGKVIVIAH